VRRLKLLSIYKTRFARVLCMSPAGTTDNSPAIHSWDHVKQRHPSPGRGERNLSKQLILRRNEAEKTLAKASLAVGPSGYGGHVVEGVDVAPA
jgi:hypothetical protein